MSLSNAKKYEFDECFVISDGGSNVNYVNKLRKDSKPVDPNKEVKFSQEDIDEKLKIAEENAKKIGKEEVINSIENQTNILLEKIINEINIILEKQDKELENISRECVKLTHGIIVRLLPKLDNSETLSDIENLISKTLSDVSEEKKVTICVTPDVYKIISKKIDKIKEEQGFEGKLILLENEELGANDCKIEWENGGIIKDMEKVYKKIDEIVEGYTNKV